MILHEVGSKTHHEVLWLTGHDSKHRWRHHDKYDSTNFRETHGPFEIEGISIEGQYMGMTSLVRLRLSMPIDDLCIPDSIFDLMVFYAYGNQFGISQFN